MVKMVEPISERRWFRLVLVALLVLHGVIHVIAPLAIWGLANFKDIDGEPTVALSDALADGLGAAWILALVLFMIAAVAALRRRGLWVPVALIGVVLSQVLIVLWWDGAWRGTIANALVLAAIWMTRPEKHEA